MAQRRSQVKGGAALLRTVRQLPVSAQNVLTNLPLTDL